MTQSLRTRIERKVIAYLACAVALVSIAALLVFPGVAHAEQNGHPVVVSMGDSYSSGEGTEPFYSQDDSNKYSKADWLAHRSEKAWPGLLAVDGVELKSIKDDGWYFVAASGAETQHVLSEKQRMEWRYNEFLGSRSGSSMLDCQMDAVKRHSGSIDYVTITIGGNDLGFSGIVEAAAYEFSSTHDNLKSKLNDAIGKFKTLKTDLLELYKTIHKEAGPQAKVIVAGYPHLFASNSSGIISPDEAELINMAVDTFNSEMRSLVASCGDDAISFVDVRSEFAGHEADYINGIMITAQSQDLDQTSVSHYSVHPNAEGQRAYARAVQDRLDELERRRASSATGSDGISEDVDIDSDVAMSLVFDVSGSMDDASAMSGMTKLASAKKQSSDFVRSVGGGSDAGGGLSVRVGIVSFSDSATVNCGLSNDPDDIVASIGALRASGMTNMHAGLSEGVDQLLGEDGPRLMVFLSDGLSNVGGSRSQILDLATQAADQDIKIYTIGFGPSGNLDEDLLQQIADITDGEYSHEDSANISSAAVGLFATMMNARLQATSQVLYDTVGSVQQGGTDQAGSFDITQNGTVQVYLYWPGSVLDMQLVDPDGKTVGEGYAGAAIDTSTIPTAITIENAKQGAWNMAVYGRDVSMAEEPYYAVAAFNETKAPVATGGGGGTSGNGEGLLFVLFVVAIACIGGVFAYTKRRSAQ